MIVVPFEGWHLQLLSLQEKQAHFQPLFAAPHYGDWLEKNGPAFSAVVDGEIIASLGITPQWENRAVAWGLIGKKARRHFVPLTKAIMRFLDLCEYRRIETPVDVGFEQGDRWAEMLGFEREGTMRAFMPDGRDCHLYARVK
jgi:RimJ/RimL family protein N-acetyltransferase